MSNWDNEAKSKDRTFGYFLKSMRDLWSLFFHEKKNIFKVLALIVLVEILGLVVPLIMKLIFDKVPQIIESGVISRYVIYLILMMFSIEVIGMIIDRFVLEVLFVRVYARLDMFWNIIAQEKLLELSLGYHERENTGKKITKISKGCSRLGHILENFRWGILPPLVFVSVNIVVVFVLEFWLGVMFLIPFIPATWLYLKGFTKYAPAWEDFEIKHEKASGLFCQSILNVQTVQSYVQERRERNSFASVRKQLKKIDIETGIAMQRYIFSAMLILRSFFFLTIIAGIYMVAIGESTLGTVVYVITTGSVASGSLWQIVFVYTQVQRKMIAVERMTMLLNEKPDVTNLARASAPKRFSGRFKIDNVKFGYPNKAQPVLKGVSLGIEPNEMIAFVGKSGEGKTTIVRLICRMYDVAEGKIALDGKDIKNLDLFWYRRKFAVVQQDVDIFDTTIAENVKYSYPDASESQVLEAVRAAYLQDVIDDSNRFPDGIKTEVGERGVRLSGGERQRVGIARAYLALLNGARVLVLDEATSNLDSQAEKAIQAMIRKLRKKKAISIIAIAHRLSTIQKADTIYVFNKGQIVEKGDHTALMRKDGIYADLVELQKLGELRK